MLEVKKGGRVSGFPRMMLVHYLIRTVIRWIALKFWRDIHCAQSMNHTVLSDPLTFPLALPAGTRFSTSTHFVQMLGVLR